jgi:zinc transport system substrate-binding protein
MKKYLLPIILRVTILLLPAASVTAVPSVVTTIHPLHSLVSSVMQGVAEPVLLLQGAVSPHDYRLRPSDMRTVSQSDVVFWIGPGFETFLAKPLALAKNIKNIALAQASGVELLPLRAGGLWEAHAHHESDATENFDPHIWLDPRNAAAMAIAIRDSLSAVDPDHAARYQTNTADLLSRLQQLELELNTELAPVKDVPYIVFHDAYQYFEQRFDTAAIGAITLDPERRPGVRRISEIRQRIARSQVRCVFSEPQFEPALVTTLIENTGAKHAELDPLGIAMTPGPQAYFQLLHNLARALRDCLQ